MAPSGGGDNVAIPIVRSACDAAFIFHAKI